MKKWLLGSLIGAILLFAWQFLSWAALGLHDKEYKYSPNQDQVVSAISSALKEDGQYMMPTVAPGATTEQKEKLMTDMEGKPFVMLNYKATYHFDMTMSMIRAFLVDLVIVVLAIYVLSGRANLTMGTAWAISLAFGFIAWLWYPYTQNIWFQTATEVIAGALMDWFVVYSILGLWLGFWLRRNP